MSKRLVIACVGLLAASVSFVAIAENKDDSKPQCAGQCTKACAKECPALATKACTEKCSKECATECKKACDKDCAKECATECPALAAKACAEECSKECATKECGEACAKECPASAAKACAKECPANCTKACCAKKCPADCKKECCAEKCPADCKKECCTKECAADCKKECCAETKCKALCPVSGKAADMAVAVDYNGGKVYMCCPGCPGVFKKDTAKFAAKANQQLVVTGQAEQVGCPLSGGKVNADTTVELCGVKVGFCCNGCKGKATKAEGDVQLAMLFGEKAFKKGFKVKSKKDTE